MEIEIKRLSHQDMDEFVELINVFEVVFEMDGFFMPDRKHLQTLLAKPHFLTLVAKADNTVVGGLTVYILDRYYSAKPLAYLYDLAVLKEFQRKGIGKALIKHLTDYCRKNGFEEVYVQADNGDDPALDFYRSTKATKEEAVVHFSYSLKVKSK